MQKLKTKTIKWSFNKTNKKYTFMTEDTKEWAGGMMGEWMDDYVGRWLGGWIDGWADE